MVGRKVVLEFPFACDRCGRIMRVGETVVQRIYPSKTFVTHIVCPGRGSARRGRPCQAGSNGREDNKQQETKDKE